MVCKPGKSTDVPNSYRPIALLPIVSKLFEKLLLAQIEPILSEKQVIPTFQFGFKRQYTTVEQALGVAERAPMALEERKHCCGLFLNVT